MAERLFPAAYGRSEHLTRAGEALADRLRASGLPVVTPYGLLLEMRRVYASGQRLYLRSDAPDPDSYNRLRRNLLDARVLGPDVNYGHRAYRLLDLADPPADEVCCLVDPLVCVSHLSALQRYGLTDRRPQALLLSRPAAAIARPLLAERMRLDASEPLPPQAFAMPLPLVSHPKVVRRRKLHLSQPSHPVESVALRGCHARITTIGQTFADTLAEPDLCGGMAHVLEIWGQHAAIYLDEIISAVDRHPLAIVKVRAGYVIEDLLGIADPRVDTWAKLAQRGGSRLLDPSKPYAPSYSARWMISTNV
ncbi:hypothetical protein [Magnetospirillum sp. UT-4]|uniref:hypothetical protein n=1 Tax=Magnetospirillum sp. UT-4 TaxID=2681467 RepID=UPI0013830F65|nr:hypothetical protein [Magnetospirillum sp. UT-4]CAA7627148.1 conserved hypothetical protein [Magnetospirillum sp. UT-4]